MTTPLWSARSLRPFLYSSSVYSYHLFLISSAFVTSLPFLSFIMPIFAWNVPLVSLIFLKRLLAFPILLFYFISLHCSLEKAFLSLLAILWNSTFRWVYLSISPLPFTSPTEMTSKTQSQLMKWEGGAWMLQAVELMKELWGWGSPWPIPNQARGQDGHEHEGRCCQRLSWGLGSSQKLSSCKTRHQTLRRSNKMVATAPPPQSHRLKPLSAWTQRTRNWGKFDNEYFWQPWKNLPTNPYRRTSFVNCIDLTFISKGKKLERKKVLKTKPLKCQTSIPLEKLLVNKLYRATIIPPFESKRRKWVLKTKLWKKVFEITPPLLQNWSSQSRKASYKQIGAQETESVICLLSYNLICERCPLVMRVEGRYELGVWD